MRWPWHRAVRTSTSVQPRLLPSATDGIAFEAVYTITWRPLWRVPPNAEEAVRTAVHAAASETAARLGASDVPAAQDAVNAALGGCPVVPRTIASLNVAAALGLPRGAGPIGTAGRRQATHQPPALLEGPPLRSPGPCRPGPTRTPRPRRLGRRTHHRSPAPRSPDLLLRPLVVPSPAAIGSRSAKVHGHRETAASHDRAVRLPRRLSTAAVSPATSQRWTCPGLVEHLEGHTHEARPVADAADPSDQPPSPVHSTAQRNSPVLRRCLAPGPPGPLSR